MEKLGDNIRFFREQFGWTQKQLADQIKISRSVLTRWERGSLTPDIQSLISLSEIFQVSLDSLVGRNNNQKLVLQEVKRIYMAKDDQIDENILQIMEYLNKNVEMKKVFLHLSKMNKVNRTLVEEIIKITVQEVLKR